MVAKWPKIAQRVVYTATVVRGRRATHRWKNLAGKLQQIMRSSAGGANLVLASSTQPSAAQWQSTDSSAQECKGAGPSGLLFAPWFSPSLTRSSSSQRAYLVSC